jgi:hypothetical protein
MRLVKFMWKKVDENIFIALKTIEKVKLNVYFFHIWMRRWLQAHVCGALDYNEMINENIVHLSQLPSFVAYSYASMWAYGNHYYMEEVGVACHTTFDFGIA